MSKKMTETQRLEIIDMLRANVPVKEIAQMANRNPSTIYALRNQFVTPPSYATSQRDDQAIGRDYLKGVHTDIILRDHKISKATLYRLRDHYGWPSRRAKITDEMRQRVIAMRQQEIPVTEIARKVGIAGSTVYAIIAQEN